MWKYRVYENERDNLPTNISRAGGFGLTALTTIAVTTTKTLTVVQFMQGIIVIDPSTGAATITTPPAADIVGYFNHAEVGWAFRSTIWNLGTSSGVLTFAGGAGVTLKKSSFTVAVIATRDILTVITAVKKGSEAVSIYSLATSAY
jgi:hypothetical protein